MARKPEFDTDDHRATQPKILEAVAGPFSASVLLTQVTTRGGLEKCQAAMVDRLIRLRTSASSSDSADRELQAWLGLVYRADQKLAKSFGVEEVHDAQKLLTVLSSGGFVSLDGRVLLARQLLDSPEFYRWYQGEESARVAPPEVRLRHLLSHRTRASGEVNDEELWGEAKNIAELLAQESIHGQEAFDEPATYRRALRIAQQLIQNDKIPISPRQLTRVIDRLASTSAHPFAPDDLRRRANEILNQSVVQHLDAYAGDIMEENPEGQVVSKFPNSSAGIRQAVASGLPGNALKIAQFLLRKMLRQPRTSDAGRLYDLVEVGIPTLEFEATAQRVLEARAGRQLRETRDDQQIVVAWAASRASLRDHPIVAYSRLGDANCRLELVGEFARISRVQAKSAHGARSRIGTVRLAISVIRDADTWQEVIDRLAPDPLSMHFVREYASILARRNIDDAVPPSLQRQVVRKLLQAEQLWAHLQVVLRQSDGCNIRAVVHDVHALPHSVVTNRLIGKYGERMTLLHTATAYFPEQAERKPEVEHIVLDALTDGRRAAIFPATEAVMRELRKVNPDLPAQPRATLRQRSLDEDAGSVGVLGKLSFDLGMRVPGGPAHSSLRDWLVHTVEVAIQAGRRVEIRPHPEEYGQQVRFFSREAFADLLPQSLRAQVRICHPGEESLVEFAQRSGLIVAYESSAAIDIALHGIPVVMSVWSAQADYSIGVHLPADRDEYAEILRGNLVPVADAHLEQRARAWIAAIQSAETRFHYRYHPRQGSNLRRAPSVWRQGELNKFFFSGDAEVDRLIDRILCG